MRPQQECSRWTGSVPASRQEWTKCSSPRRSCPRRWIHWSPKRDARLLLSLPCLSRRARSRVDPPRVHACAEFHPSCPLLRFCLSWRRLCWLSLRHVRPRSPLRARPYAHRDRRCPERRPSCPAGAGLPHCGARRVWWWQSFRSSLPHLPRLFRWRPCGVSAFRVSRAVLPRRIRRCLPICLCAVRGGSDPRSWEIHPTGRVPSLRSWDVRGRFGRWRPGCRPGTAPSRSARSAPPHASGEACSTCRVFASPLNLDHLAPALVPRV